MVSVIALDLHKNPPTHFFSPWPKKILFFVFVFLALNQHFLALDFFSAANLTVRGWSTKKPWSISD